MSANKLNDDEIGAALERLPGWTVQDAKLHREFKFPDFAHAFGFMAVAALQIERVNHHPEWSNVYNWVRIDLTTHHAGGITSKDVCLAEILERTSRRFA
ncbi:MAG TPA: 4a-hydroxytetrahydrobiopterin dehydratase [Bryobacteraceae bacterium]|nr:4a-hydroxytetrahydrobiopterin dehydratase [Bryobacteraceae bacterium]